MDIRQSPKYAQFMREIGWQVEKIGQWQAFIKKFPLIGSLIKIQRISHPIPFKEIETLAKKHHSFKVVIESDMVIAIPTLRREKQSKSSPSLLDPPLTSHPQPNNYPICPSPFLPTKTIQIDLTRPEKEIFKSFKLEKKRAIRRAEKNNIMIKKGSAQDFIYLKRKSLLEKGILPIGDKKDILALERSFSPENISFLLVYPPNTPKSPKPHNRPLAGILLLFWEETAYYWQAASTKKGKKLSCPSLLVWEALKLSKKKGCRIFDFEGIYDDKFPIESWKGFTRFKQGFGGKEIEFPKPLTTSSKYPWSSFPPVSQNSLES